METDEIEGRVLLSKYCDVSMLLLLFQGLLRLRLWLRRRQFDLYRVKSVKFKGDARRRREERLASGDVFIASCCQAENSSIILFIFWLKVNQSQRQSVGRRSPLEASTRRRRVPLLRWSTRFLSQPTSTNTDNWLVT